MQHFEQMAEIVAKSGAKFEMRDLKCEHFIALSIFFEHVENFGWLAFLQNFLLQQDITSQIIFLYNYLCFRKWLVVCVFWNFLVQQLDNFFNLFDYIQKRAIRSFCIILFGGC
eukprot:TRINITY_DN3202_c1_g1_i1.p6 TRINITY_DN3202_c1_g1~~TRINITY_DN3202_c1_g1_i1.p6  ORF type:complete len:113 (+),score=5.59 TRINITY_DN3202_c1_g1_i1:593-931(+)